MGRYDGEEQDTGFLDERDRRILETLRGRDGPVSGEGLAAGLGISRVALWKRVEALRHLGYRIESERRGYRLLGEDVVLPDEFADAANIVYEHRLPSTMDEAWRRAEAGADSGTMVVADSQSSGRGQHGRVWISPSGGLYLTLVLRTSLPLAYAGSVVLEAGHAVIAYMHQRGGRLEFQWPNDLMLGGAKVGGILVEASGSPERVRFFTVGLGLNLKEVALPDRDTAGVAEAIRDAPKRREIAGAFRTAMTMWGRNPELRPELWFGDCSMRYRPVTGTDWEGRPFAGVSTGFTRSGGLVVDGRTLAMGETKLIRLQGEVS